MLDPELVTPDSFRPLMRAEYHQLVELGVFDDEKVELLRGVIVKMSPQGDRHKRLMIFLTRRLVELTDRRFDIAPALPLAATVDSEPEPDFAITNHDPSGCLPTSALLVIEISNSSLRKDRGVKRGIYAEAMVPEYWIIDVSREGALSVEVYTEPDGTTYAQQRTLRDGDILRPLHVPLDIAVADLPR